MGFFKKLVSGLSKTRNNIVSGLNSIFHGFSKIDEDFYTSSASCASRSSRFKRAISFASSEA